MFENKQRKCIGVIIDGDMKFDEYIPKKCKKAGRKLYALGKVCKFLKLVRRRSLMKTFIESQIAYCPLYGYSVTKFEIIALIICKSKC